VDQQDLHRAETSYAQRIAQTSAARGINNSVGARSEVGGG